MSSGFWPRAIACAATVVFFSVGSATAQTVVPRSLEPEQPPGAGLSAAQAIAPGAIDPTDRGPFASPRLAPLGEPFGMAAAPGGSDPLSAKWHAVEESIRAEADLLALCRADRAGCHSRPALRFLSIVDAAQVKSGRARIGEVNRAVNVSIRPMSDLAQYGLVDYWASPLTTLASGAGDCEDYAITKYEALRAAGIADDDLRLVIVHHLRIDEDHAVAAVRVDGRWLVLDNRWLALADAADLVSSCRCSRSTTPASTASFRPSRCRHSNLVVPVFGRRPPDKIAACPTRSASRRCRSYPR
jgi:predicted transglutaminase-like cysteine proteinase